MTKLIKIWKRHHITYRIVKSLVCSVYLYGAQCWILKQRNRMKINAFETYCWHRIRIVFWILKRNNLSIIQHIQIKKRLHTTSFFSYVIRRNGLKRLTVVNGKRSRGISPIRYSDLNRQETTNVNKNYRRLIQMGADSTKNFTKSQYLKISYRLGRRRL